MTEIWVVAIAVDRIKPESPSLRYPNRHLCTQEIQGQNTEMLKLAFGHAVCNRQMCFLRQKYFCREGATFA